MASPPCWFLTHVDPSPTAISFRPSLKRSPTDGVLSKMDLKVLEDDRHAFPSYEVSVAAREELLNQPWFADHASRVNNAHEQSIAHGPRGRASTVQVVSYRVFNNPRARSSGDRASDF